MWKEIDGYYGKYQISVDGEVKSVARIKSNNQPIPEKILKQSSDSSGYKYVSLYNSDTKKNERKRIHRLVAIAYVDGVSDEKNIVNHIDGIKINNTASNLEWCTHGENKSHSFKVLGEKHWLKGKTGKRNPYSKKVEMLSMSGEVIEEFDAVNDAVRKYNISQGNIISVLSGKRNQAGGYKWRYI